MSARRAAGGFTLIELMIVVSIVAILAAVAYPSYRDSVARGRRADAKGVLLENAQLIERQYTISNAYDRKGDGSALSDPPIARSPRDGANVFYDIGFTGTHDASQYTLRAVPRGGMATDPCGTLTIDHAGVKGVTGGTLGVSECWER